MHPFAGQKIDAIQQIKQTIYWRKSSDVRFSCEKNIFGKKQYFKEVCHQGIAIKYTLSKDERQTFMQRLLDRKKLLSSYQTMLKQVNENALIKKTIEINERPFALVNPGEYATTLSSSTKNILLTRISKRSIVLCLYNPKQTEALLAHIDDFTDFNNLSRTMRKFSKEDSLIHLIACNDAEEFLRLEVFARIHLAGYKFQTLDFSQSKQTMMSTIGIDTQDGALIIPLLDSSSIHLSPPRKDAVMNELQCAYTGTKPKLMNSSMFKTPQPKSNNWAYCCDIDMRVFQLDIF